MSKGRINRYEMQRQRFEDLDGGTPNDATSFYFDLKLMLPPGMTAHDMQRARQIVEHRLQRTLRKKDRVKWTADGLFLTLATAHPARAGAAAERIHQDLCEVLARPDSFPRARREVSQAAPVPRPRLEQGVHPRG